MARSGALAAIVVALSAAAHVVGGGTVPPGLALTLVPVIALPAALLTRRRLGVAGVTVLLGTGQLGVHRVFEAAHAGTAMPGMAAGLPCHPGATSVPIIPGLPAGQDLPSSGPMLAAHVVATFALVGVVLLGDRLLYAVRRVCRPIPHAESIVLPALRPMAPAAVVRRLVGRPGRSAPFLRGPPALRRA